MKRNDLWAAKLVAARAHRRIVVRQLNALQRKDTSLTREITLLENKLERHMANITRKAQSAK
jgi:hypothetical protein